MDFAARQTLSQSDGSLQRSKHVFHDIVVDHVLAQACQVIDHLHICLVGIQAAVLARRDVNAELLFGEFAGANLKGVRPISTLSRT